MSTPGSQPARDVGDDQEYPTFVPQLPLDLLIRHGARILDPATAVVAPGRETPQPTVYRTGTLIVPSEVLTEKPTRDHVLRSLKKLGLTLGDWRSQVKNDFVVVRLLAGDRPAVADAWPALQWIRHEADLLASKDTKQKLINARIRELVNGIQLEHLLFSANLVLKGAPGPYQGVGPGVEPDSYVGSPGFGPIPVKLLTKAPPRSSATGGGISGRRPVIAVVDSGIGIGGHPWLNGYVRYSTQLEQYILAAGQQERAQLPLPARRPLINGSTDGPVSSRPLVGDLDICYGHGMFVAGLLRQLAPEADVLMVRVMHPDGIVYEAELLAALKGLLAQVKRAQQVPGQADDMVDVITLSLGYYDEKDDIRPPTSAIASVIDDLTRLGVLVVAAVGNDATQRPFWPAALVRQTAVSHKRLASVGALNPSGSRALFSNGDDWVSHWRSGAGIISTLPIDTQGARQPNFVAPPSVTPDLPPRESLDFDAFRSGFGLWNGTSFAAPIVAAELANELIGKLADASDGQPYDVDSSKTRAGAEAALGKLLSVDERPPVGP